MRRLGFGLILLALTAAVTAGSLRESLRRYHDLQSGWSWDLAYYNQWFWALTQGDGQISVRPVASYADEGPSVWKMNYVAPIRFLLAPIYCLFPDPRTLLVIQNVLFWLLIPAAYTLVRSETGSDWAALAASALVPATPLLWPLVWNDFREVQIALPFVVWAIQGYRCRNVRVAALGIGGMIACRQEFAVVTATLAILPPRQPEDVGRTYRWAQAVLLIGTCWLLFVFFGYLHWMVAANAPALYVGQFGGPKAPLWQTLETALGFLAVGLGSWTVLALLSPRAALLALPWIWGLSSGKWALRYIGTEHWHHVRYTAPMVALVLAAGLLGWSRLVQWLGRARRGRAGLAAAWVAAALGLAAADRALLQAFFAYEPPISHQAAAEIWPWIERVGHDEAVLAVYDVCAPLSSRRRLFSYILVQNRPRGFPQLGPEFRWVFLRKWDIPKKILLDQGFVCVYDGSFLAIFRRPPNWAAAQPEKKEEGANFPRASAVKTKLTAEARRRAPVFCGSRPGVYPGGLEELEREAFLGHVSPDDVRSSQRRPEQSEIRPHAAVNRPPRCMSPHFSIPPQAGGCEGLAMLNRTNRTLSANLNRLNLRTRSFALLTGTNMDQTALTVRHAHGQHVRAGITSGPASAIARYARPAFPASSSLSPGFVASWGIEARVVVGATSALAQSLAEPSGRVCWVQGDRAWQARPNQPAKPHAAKPALKRSGGAMLPSGRSPRMPLAAAAGLPAAAGG